MTSIVRFLCVAGLLAGAAPAAAAPSRTTITADYRVSYRPDRQVYCLYVFADADLADPHPGGPGTTCRTLAAWAQRGITIQDPQRASLAPGGARP